METDVALVTVQVRVMNSPDAIEVELAVNTTVGAVDDAGGVIDAFGPEPQSLKNTEMTPISEAIRNFVTHDIWGPLKNDMKN
jgi:hypothetical protein